MAFIVTNTTDILNDAYLAMWRRQNINSNSVSCSLQSSFFVTPIFEKLRYEMGNQGSNENRWTGSREGLFDDINPRINPGDVLTGVRQVLTGVRQVLTGVRQVLTGVRQVLTGVRQVLTGSQASPDRSQASPDRKSGKSWQEVRQVLTKCITFLEEIIKIILLNETQNWY